MMGFAMPWVDDLFTWYIFILVMGSILSFMAGLKGWLRACIAGVALYILAVWAWLGFLDQFIGIFLFIQVTAYAFCYWVGKVWARGD